LERGHAAEGGYADGGYALIQFESRLRLQFSWIAANLSLLTLITFAAVIVQYAGYFFWPAGLSIPPIDTQDLGLSSILLVGTVLILYNFWTSIDIGSSLPGLLRYLAYGIVLGITVLPSVLLVSQSGFDPQSLLFWENTIWLAISLVAFLVIALASFRTRKDQQFGYREISLTLVIGSLFLWLFGIHAFIIDLKGARLAKIQQSDISQNVYVLRVMSSIVVAYKIDTCNLLMLNRSSVTSIEFIHESKRVDLIEQGKRFNCAFKW
jgi:hypothetical protein